MLTTLSRLPLRATALSAVLIGTALTAPPVIWHLSGHSEALPPRPAPAPTTQVTEIAPMDLEPVRALSPFGAVPPPAAPAPEGPSGETTLDLVLHGVVVREDATLSIAFIGANGASQGYTPGEAVAGGRATLVEVAARRVVLDVDGELQTLSFAGTAPEEVAEEAPPEIGFDRLRALVKSQTSDDDIAEPSGELTATAPQTTQDYINMWRERIRQNPGEVLDSIGLIPTDNGYRIADDHDSGVGRAGLRAGDIVTRVNGQAVGDVDSDRKLYDDVAASGLAQIEIERDGQTITMSFPLQ